MLINEVLHKGKRPRKNFILMKLDTIKAFDYLEWGFLFKYLERVGFGPGFILMIKVIHASATSAMMIKGRLTQPINLKRSLWQDSPLSPLVIVFTGG